MFPVHAEPSAVGPSLPGHGIAEMEAPAKIVLNHRSSNNQGSLALAHGN